MPGRCASKKSFPWKGKALLVRCQLPPGHSGMHANGVEEVIVGGQRARGPGPGAKTWE